MVESDISQLPRLNNNEFLNFIPHLELEELLMTQIKVNGRWDFLFSASFKKENQLNSLSCLACKEFVECPKFSNHIRAKFHEEALKNVEQFYHPFYTYNKDCEKVAGGGDVSENELGAANKLSNDTKNLEKTPISKLKLIAQCVRECEGNFLSSFTDNEALAKTILAKNVTKPEEILIDVKLPLPDILTIEFSVEKGKWIRMVTVNKTANTKFYCALCSKFCFGIITVDNHFKGLAHKRAQIACLAVRCSSYKFLTKNCIFSHGEKFSLNVKKSATQSFNNDILPKSNDTENLQKIEGAKETPKIKEEKPLESAQNDSETNTKLALSASIADKVKNIRETIQFQNKNVEGLIGVEYVVKIIKTTTDKYPMYECCLCEIVLNENRMQGHLTGYNHRLKYCELHYPNTIEKFKDAIGHVKYIDYFNVMNHILSKIATGIEEHHGRSTPFVALLSTYTKMRTELIAKIYSYPNACQQHGPSFTNVISEEEIKQIITEHSEYVTQTNNYARFAEKPEQKLYLNQRCHDPSKRNSEYVDIRKRKRSSSPSVNKKPSKRPSRSRSPQNVSVKKKIQSRQHLVNTPNASSFHRDEEAVVTYEIERMYREYRKNPESHPLYDEEWNGFWRRRKEQLISQGIDHRSHNYQPEWVKYFKNRLEELFEKEICDSKMEVRKRSSEFERSNSSNRFINHIGLKPDNAYGIQDEKWSPDVISHSSHSRYMESENKMADGKPTVIHVLRLLTALEDYLGSLGAKIMNLLSKALMIEKNCNNFELEQQILTFDNCTLLETAVEKLKGILFAGLLDRTKLQGFNRVIQFTTDLLKHADKMGWRSMQQSFPNKVEKPVFLNLADAVQNTRTNTFSSTQKSLSDTLMELLSMQKTNSQTSVNNSHNPKIYNDHNQGMHIPAVDQYSVNANSRGGHWQNLGKKENFLTKPPYFEGHFNGGTKNDAINQNFTNPMFNKPSNFVNIGTLGRIPNPNYKPIGDNFYQTEDYGAAMKRNASLNKN
ncbi:PREDICTED: uncharacterized protein CG7065-like [Rhagoletis zephyria]|uniref:uncharacterized protein CG7065-like n=1 Tax=Rhagoletis zephyria TaxID=28612 RepID=UPI00081131C4|nr:PREDICTED: uncharacterized protein CG7065-like [Rhagoletis zephyria]